jgi:hypothetical protein
MPPKPASKKPTIPSGPSNAKIIYTKIRSGFHKNVVLKIKGYIIHAWLNEFEDQYLKTFKIISENDTDSKAAISSIYKRMDAYNPKKDNAVIIVKYVSENKYCVLASQTQDEKEYAEFQRWKKTHKKEAIA